MRLAACLFKVVGPQPWHRTSAPPWAEAVGPELGDLAKVDIGASAITITQADDHSHVGRRTSGAK